MCSALWCDAYRGEHPAVRPRQTQFRGKPGCRCRATLCTTLAFGHCSSNCDLVWAGSSMRMGRWDQELRCYEMARKSEGRADQDRRGEPDNRWADWNNGVPSGGERASFVRMAAGSVEQSGFCIRCGLLPLFARPVPGFAGVRLRVLVGGMRIPFHLGPGLVSQ